MFVHAVYFWLREDLTPEGEAAFKQGLDSLATIESVHQCYIGPPAATDRPIIDRSYSYALVVVFTDEAAHDTYQSHPTHDAFRDNCAQYWTKVLIYDSLG
jgi:hypothetical protein